MTVAGYDQDSDEAFRRMFERDKELLRQLGIPLDLRATDAWEVEYGYVVPPEDYRLRDPGLTDEERAALWLAAQAVRLGGQAPGPGAIFKLGGVPPAGAGEPLAADLGESVDDLATSFVAVTERRHLKFRYRDKERLLRPYGLVHRRGHWYLAGAEEGSSEVRAYRLDRAEALELGGALGAFERPRDFSAASAVPSAPWEAGADDVEATVHFDPEIAWWAERQLTSAPATRLEDGGLEVRMRVANPDAFVGWLLGFEDRAEVVGPPDLRDLLIARVRGGQ